MTRPCQAKMLYRDGRWRFVHDGGGVDVGPMLSETRWKVGPLCGMLGVSRRTLQRAVVESLGITPKEWLRRERIVAAIHRLREAVSVKQVAADLGFRHAGDFTGEFRFWTGVGPLAWRAAQVERDRAAGDRLAGRRGM